MTKPNPLARVTLSRQMLHKYLTLPGGTADDPEWLLKQIAEEIVILDCIAKDVPANAESIGRLIEDWREFVEMQKRRAN